MMNKITNKTATTKTTMKIMISKTILMTRAVWSFNKVNKEMC